MAIAGSDERGPYVLAFFLDGMARRFSLAHLIAAHPAFAPLRDPIEHARLTVLPNGHGLEWACGGDVSARHIFATGEPVEATPSEQETAHLLSSPANAERLKRALARSRAGGGRRMTPEEVASEVGLT